MAARDEKEALAISQDLLDRSGAALMSGDPTDFVPCFFLPHILNTFDKERIIKTEAQLLETFRLVSANYREDGITDLVRTAVSAEFISEDEIHSTHITRWLRGTQPVAEPFPIYALIRRHEGRWAVARSEYAIPEELRIARTLSRVGLPTEDTPPQADR